MLNFYFYDNGARLTPDPNIYYRTTFYQTRYHGCQKQLFYNIKKLAQ